jgi:O-acetyl-ADP-ribose deacetylase (regulator of RNase III)
MVQHCTAIGFTQYEVSSWATGKEEPVEFVGIPGFPGERFPRVAGLIRHGASEANRSPIKYRHGSILDISYPGRRIVCQLVNDKAIRWGGGIARRMAERYPEAEEHYASKMMIIPQSARLGSVIYSPLERDLTLASVVGQAGFGPSLFPRVRYEALERGLRDVSEFAIANAASVHLPKLGTGAAGGDWGIVEEIIDNELVRKGLDVVVYDLPPKRKQLELF